MAENCASIEEIPIDDIEMEVEPFARGDIGKVYMAKWRNQDVVIKVIKAESEEEERAVKCEVYLNLRLSHPNIIRLLGITTVKSRKLGIVMEKAEHGSLDQWIGKMDREKQTQIALGIIDGLEYVHSQHVIHRSIKPSNILMFGPKNDMIPKIADFGVSKVSERVTVQTKVGEDLYMAPEVRVHSQYGFTADIFSLAMMLFEIFNEQLVRQASVEVKRFIMGLQSGRVGNIPESCKVPEYLRNVIEQGWNNNPEDRPPLSEYRSTLRRGKIFFLSAKLFNIIINYMALSAF